MNEIITIDTSDAVSAKVGNDLYSSRENVVNSMSYDVEATVSVSTYNRYEKVVRCVESILKNTTDVNYKLILICNGCDKDSGKTLEFFKSVKHPKKVIFNVTKNIGSTFTTNIVEKNLEGKYFVMVADDVIVTPRWLSNMIKCAESDSKIGMVNPVASNISNYQQVYLEYSNYDEMQEAADKHNKSDPQKWCERVRMVSMASLFKVACLEAIGTTFDTGFFHDFGDDDLSFKIRRAGYKCVLAMDTWVCHDHDLSCRDENLAAQSINIGRKNFKDKYYGIDAWDDVNYIHEFIGKLTKVKSIIPKILGIDVNCGAPIVEIKNKLREYDVYKVNSNAFTEDAKYFIDLQTICGSENVVCDKPESIINYYDSEMFDYIVIGKNINSYSSPFDFIKTVIKLLSKDGQLFIYLKNTNDIFSFLNMIGYRNVYNKSNYAFNFALEDFYAKILQMNLKIELIEGKLYDSNVIAQDDLNFVTSKIKTMSEADINETIYRLMTDKFAFVITKS